MKSVSKINDLVILLKNAERDRDFYAARMLYFQDKVEDQNLLIKNLRMELNIS